MKGQRPRPLDDGGWAVKPASNGLPLGAWKAYGTAEETSKTYPTGEGSVVNPGGFRPAARRRTGFRSSAGPRP